MKVYIYALKNSQTKEVKYIGMSTVHPLSRYGGHIASAFNKNGKEYNSYKYIWFRETYKTTKKFPSIKVLKVVNVNSIQEGHFIESLYIQKYSEKFTLCNKDRVYTNYKVGQYNLEGNLVKTWNSVISIILSKELELKDIGNLMQCLDNRRKSLKGYMWKVGTRNKINLETKLRSYEVDKYVKPIYMYDLDGNYITKFKSAREALGYNYKNISQVCLGEKKTHKNRRFSFDYVDKLPSLRKRPVKDMSKLNKALLCFDVNMNFIKEYKSCKDVQTDFTTHIDSGSLSKAARGLMKTYKNYVWRYK